MSNKIRQAIEIRKVGPAHKASAAARKSVLLVMADRADDKGHDIFLSKSSMAKITELSKSSVKLIVAGLITDKLILETGQRPCVHGHTVNYSINIKAVERLPLNGFGKRQPSDLGGRSLTPGEPEADPLGGRRLTPNHPSNHPGTTPLHRKGVRSSEYGNTRGSEKSTDDHLKDNPEYCSFLSSLGAK